MNRSSISRLYTGNRAACAAQVEREVQKIFCPHNACQLCMVCIAIAKKQYAPLLWLTAEKTYYTRAELDDVYDAARFSRSEHEPFVCVLEEVDRVSPAVGAALLKMVEEPPAGFYWMFTTQREHDVLPTLVSRSVTVPVRELMATEHEEFFMFFTHPHQYTLAACQDLLEKYKLNEYESRVMFDKLFTYWVTKLEHNPEYLKLVAWYRTMLASYPMPGSSKVFWRTVYAHTLIYTSRAY